MHRCLLLAAALVASSLSAAEVSRYKPHDFVFRATPPADPFRTDFYGWFHGPDGQTLRVPGFYDGGDVWKIRFSAPREGLWRLRTVSTLPGLNDMQEQITAGPNTNPNIHGVLRVDQDHPYHFRFEDGTRYFLMGYEADWLGLQEWTTRSARPCIA